MINKINDNLFLLSIKQKQQNDKIKKDDIDYILCIDNLKRTKDLDINIKYFLKDLLKSINGKIILLTEDANNIMTKDVILNNLDIKNNVPKIKEEVLKYDKVKLILVTNIINIINELEIMTNFTDIIILYPFEITQNFSIKLKNTKIINYPFINKNIYNNNINQITLKSKGIIFSEFYDKVIYNELIGCDVILYCDTKIITLVINDKIKKYKVNNIKKINHNNFIKAITRYTISLGNTEKFNNYLYVYNSLLDYCKYNNSEELNYCNRKLLLLSGKIKNRVIDDLNIDNDDINIIITWANKCTLMFNKVKHQSKFNKRMIDNIHYIENLQNIIEIEYDENIINNNPDFNRSIEFFKSNVTLSDWHEELESGNALGLVIKTYSNNLVKLGFNNTIRIDNITTTLFPVIDFIDKTIDFFSNNTHFNLNEKNIISGTEIGDGNSVIPLYINKDHWSCARKYLELCLGIIFSHNPLGYVKNHKLYLFSVFLKMNTMIFTNNNNNNNKFINTFMALFRTCAQICFEEKYNYGLSKYIKSFLNNPLKRVWNSMSDYNPMLGQILCTGYDLKDDINNLIICILEELLRKDTCTIDEDYVKFLFDNANNEQLNQEFDKIINDEILLISNDHLNKILSFLKMIKIMKKVYNELGSYSKFIKHIDSNYGLLDEKFIIMIKKEITINPKVITINDILFDYNKYKIINIIIKGNKYKSNKSKIISIKNGEYKKNFINI